MRLLVRELWHIYLASRKNMNNNDFPPVFIITGVSRGIGLHATQHLLREGACVVGVGRSLISETLAIQTLLSSYASKFKYLEADVTDSTTSSALIELALSFGGYIDGVIYNAGIIEPIQRLSNLDLTKFQHLVSVNLYAIIDLAQKAIPYLKKSQRPGRQIFLSSRASWEPYTAWYALFVAKS
jgi:NAD(P)-dependent dehydrogenase (short-subunit alcohol dehydrogenase family)